MSGEKADDRRPTDDLSFPRLASANTYRARAKEREREDESERKEIERPTAMIPRSPASILSGGRKSGISLALNGSGPSAPGGISLRERLSARSRVTNLGILLLLGLCSLSVLLNLRFMIFGGRGARSLPPPGFGSWTTFHGLTPKMLSENQPLPAKGTEKLNHLVVVVGHAVWGGSLFLA